MIERRVWREKEISHCLILSLLVARLQPETGKSIQASQLGNEKSRAGTQARVPSGRRPDPEAKHLSCSQCFNFRICGFITDT